MRPERAILAKAAALVRAGEGSWRVFRFMSAPQADFPIATMARVLGVPVSGSYAWRSRPAAAHATSDAALLRRIRMIHAASHGTYGAPRVHVELRAEGTAVARKRRARPSLRPARGARAAAGRRSAAGGGGASGESRRGGRVGRVTRPIIYRPRRCGRWGRDGVRMFGRRVLVAATE